MEAFDTIKITEHGITLAIRIYPGDSTEPIVLLHGGPGLDDYLAPIAQFLAPTFHVVTYDQRGSGASSHHGPYRIQDHVNDLEVLRQHLGTEHLHLFGHS